MRAEFNYNLAIFQGIPVIPDIIATPVSARDQFVPRFASKEGPNYTQGFSATSRFLTQFLAASLGSDAGSKRDNCAVDGCLQGRDEICSVDSGSVSRGGTGATGVSFILRTQWLTMGQHWALFQQIWNSGAPAHCPVEEPSSGTKRRVWLVSKHSSPTNRLGWTISGTLRFEKLVTITMRTIGDDKLINLVNGGRTICHPVRDLCDFLSLLGLVSVQCDWLRQKLMSHRLVSCKSNADWAIRRRLYVCVCLSVCVSVCVSSRIDSTTGDRRIGQAKSPGPNPTISRQTVLHPLSDEVEMEFSLPRIPGLSVLETGAGPGIISSSPC
ncbi:hypothetical protein EGW08_014389 [Elysia chlorotica]|uniref:Uncharacterized protein n=1 Tax=Elysia chlorotica TaxID=188477 RepID=A0A3S0ZXV0_ELYCH|nr:hypothetical protein EGW08_014389 [Elysia chlorotica]